MIDQEMQHCRKIVRFDPTISTANQGDFIIRNACEHVLHDCFLCSCPSPCRFGTGCQKCR